MNIKVAKISGAGAAAIIFLIPTVAEAASTGQTSGEKAQAIFGAIGESVLCGLMGGCGPVY